MSLLTIARTAALSSAAGPVTGFLRNVLIARLIGVDDFAVSVVIAALAAAADILGDLGWEKYLVTHHDNDDDSLDAVHFAKLVTGGVTALLLILASPLIAHLTGRPDAWLAFAAVALVPILRSLANSEYKIRQRRMDFGAEARVEYLRGAAELLAALAAGLLLRSYWATVAALLTGAVCMVIASRRFATRPYRPRWHRVQGTELMAFGRPLLVNNLLVFLSTQADRLLVGFQYPASAVAAYGASLALIAGPQSVANRLGSSLALPFLSSRREESEIFERRYRLVGHMMAIGAAAISLPFMMLGDTLVSLIFGPAFAGYETVVRWLAIVQGVQLLRVWPTVTLIALRQTRAIPKVNLARVSGIGMALVAALDNRSISWIPACLAAGEIVGFLMMMNAARRASGRRLPMGGFEFGTLVLVWISAWAAAEWFTLAGHIMLLPLLALAVLVVLGIPAFRLRKKI